MSIKDVINILEAWAPPALQESYDNSGLIVGDSGRAFTSSLVCLDCTEEIVDEAAERGANLIIAHHPIIFRGLKRLTGADYVERTVIKAIKKDVAIYAIHTNLDNVRQGVNERIADRIGLSSVNRRILLPKSGRLMKLELYVPNHALDDIKEAIWNAGGGGIGNYDECSFSISGTGTFRPNEVANPSTGERGQRSTEDEVMLSVIYPDYLSSSILNAMKAKHPYEEVAYQEIRIENTHQGIGSGLIGSLSEPMRTSDFIQHLKESMELEVLKHTDLVKEEIEQVALLGGSGVFGLKAAISQGADVFITGDVKHHEYFDAEGRIILMDIGHYESERFTMELIQEYLAGKLPNFAHLLTEHVTNPVKYA